MGKGYTVLSERRGRGAEEEAMNRSHGAEWATPSRARAARRAIRRIGTVSLVFAWAILAPVAQAAEQKLTASDGAAGDQFGFSVAISGNTSIVGARGGRKR
jgi:hypothetical protein